jgi:peptide subunit release factor RF-3
MISAFRHPYADDAYSIFTAVQIKQKVIDASRGVFKFIDITIGLKVCYESPIFVFTAMPGLSIA